MDPMFLMWMAQNPEMGGLLDAAGIPPPGGGAGFGGVMPGAQAPTTGWEATVNPAGPVGQVQGLDQAQKMAMMAKMAGMQGMKAPAPIQPIMSGGVTGGVKPPEVGGGKIAAAAPAIQALLQAAIGGGGGQLDPLRVPQLGALMPRF